MNISLRDANFDSPVPLVEEVTLRSFNSEGDVFDDNCDLVNGVLGDGLRE